MPHRRTNIVMLLLTASLLSAAILLAQPASPPPEVPPEAPAEAAPQAPDQTAPQPAPQTPSAAALLNSSARYIEARKSFNATITTTQKVEGPQGQQEATARMQMAAEAPNRFAVRPLPTAENPSNMQIGTIVSDGAKLYVYLPPLNAYTVADAPKTFAELMATEENPDLTMASGPTGMPRMLMTVEGVKKITEAREPQYVGLEQIADQPVHRVRVHVQEGPGVLAVDIWIQAGEQPVIRRMQPDIQAMIEERDDLPPQMRGMKITFIMELADWQIDQPLDKQIFTFQPPADAKEVESLLQAAQEPREPQSQLEGKPAPPITLNTVDGQAFNLKDVKARVVVLDFWATWCGPCVQALPGLEKVHNWGKQQDGQVAVYTVNLREQPGEVQAFWKQHKLTMPVLMDTDGRVAQSYNVTGIPQTVIIADGRVAKVHVGYRPGLENQLQQEIEAILKK